MKFKELPFKNISIILYIISMLLPAVGSKAIGISMLQMGFVSLFYLKTIPLGICWLANVFFWVNLYDIKKRKKPKFGYSLTAILLGLLFLLVRLLYIDTQSSNIRDITGHLNIGYFIWMLSFVGLLLYDLLQWEFDLSLIKNKK